MNEKQTRGIPIENVIENLSFKSNQNKLEFIRGP